MQFIEINKQNINLLIDYLLLSKDKFKCIVIPDLPNIINLIGQNCIQNICNYSKPDLIIMLFF